MPPQFLFDLSKIPSGPPLFDKEHVRRINPQRGAMEHLDAVVHLDVSTGVLVGYKDVLEDEFWVEGHIPGRPLLPGVIMIEAAAQLASFFTKEGLKWEGFIGFGAVEECKFRQQVVPGQRMYLIGQKIWERHRRINCRVQGVVNGTLAFEASIVGSQF